jgi:hypothetical protein
MDAPARSSSTFAALPLGKSASFDHGKQHANGARRPKRRIQPIAAIEINPAG